MSFIEDFLYSKYTKGTVYIVNILRALTPNVLVSLFSKYTKGTDTSPTNWQAQPDKVRED